MKSIRYLILGVVGVFILFAADRVTADKTEPGSVQRAVIKIDSLSCGGCFNTISQALSPLEGYSGMGMNLFRKRIAVDFTEPLTADEITRTLSQIGYPGTVETVESVTEKESFAYLDQKRAGAGPGRGGCCSSGGYPGNTAENQNPSGPGLSTGGSCCILPDVLQPAEKL
ncbi:MAG: heavy-metal-associated domain-containing protein [Desulfobacula sp.]|nr:heavy-metal-associated domain-containing protein [Desulfobacula sp.]